MHTPLGRGVFAGLNAIGGAAVLASYAAGLGPDREISALWGGVPASWRPFYTANMLLAAAGYFPFTAYWLFAVDPERVRIAGRFGFGAVIACYALILFPSALWLPLTGAYLDAPTVWRWWGVVAVLAGVALGTLGVLGGLLTLAPRERRGFHRAAVIGCVPFAVQTVLLDAIAWPAMFHR